MKQIQRHILALLAGGGSFLFPVTSQAMEGWVTDFEQAKKIATEEKKDLFTLFTGSDWCPPCIQMEKNIFSKDEFLKAAKEDFVLVFLDYPQQKEQSAEVKEQNAKLSETYGVQAFPTVMFMDASGKPYAMDQGGVPMEVPEYLEHLDEVQKQGEQINAALKAGREGEGPEAANKLTEGLKMVPAESLGFYDEDLVRLKKLDPEDKSGFQKVQAGRKAATALQEEMEALYQEKKFEVIIEKIDDFVKEYEPEGEVRQNVMMAKTVTLAEQEKFDEAIKVAEGIVKESPDSPIGQYAAQMIEQLQAAKKVGAGD